MEALYSYADGNGVQVLPGTHVDDLIWAAMPKGEAMIIDVIRSFRCGKPEEMNFRYCGKEVAQDGRYSIVVTCKSTTLKLEPTR